MADHYKRLKAALSDRYTILRQLGSGGMAFVYLAHDVRHEREVAIKVLRPQLAEALGAERFLREIRIAANLHHPHILPLYDSGDADGFLYYVMPYEEGLSLRDRLAKEGELPVADVTRILRDVVDALAHAHKSGVVHRDIKPDNILLSGRHALVTDFGVAKAVSDATGPDRLTTAGFAVGTPAYMAPEQAAADENVDHRADIYAVGILAYELLTGEPPFAGPTPLMALAAQARGTAEPISRHRPSVPPRLEHVVMKCLEQNAADRWQSAKELLPHLEALATASSDQADFTAPRVGVTRPTKIVALITSIGVLLVATALALSLGRNPAPPVSSRVVVSVLENQTGDPALDAIGVMAGHWITQGLQRSGIVEVVPWPEALQSSRYVKSEANAGRVRTPIRALAVETGAATVVSGAYYRRGEAVQFHVEVTDANRSRSLGVLDPEVAQLVSLENAVEALRGRVMGLLAVTFDERLAAHARSVSRPPTFEAYQAFHQGMERYIGEEFRNAVTHFSRAFELDSTFALSLQFAAINLYAMRDYRRADSVLGVLARFRDQFTDLDAAWVDYLEAEFDGDHDRALQAIRRAAKLAPYSKAVYNRAHLALNTNRPREAVTALQSLDPERGAMRGWFGYWSVLCTALHETGDHERELEAARRAQELFPERALMAKFHAALALAALERFDELNELFDNMHLLPPVEGLPAGDMMRWTVNDLRGHGHHAAAQQVNTRAIEWFETQPPEQAATEIHRYYFGIVLYLARRWAEATRVFETLTHDFPENLNYRGYLGVLAARRGDPDRAMQIAEELQSVDRAYLFGLHTWWRARIQSVLGDFERAVALLREAGAQGHVEDWHTPVIDFESLQGYPPFRELTRLKG